MREKIVSHTNFIPHKYDPELRPLSRMAGPPDYGPVLGFGLVFCSSPGRGERDGPLNELNSILRRRRCAILVLQVRRSQ